MMKNLYVTFFVLWVCVFILTFSVPRNYMFITFLSSTTLMFVLYFYLPKRRNRKIKEHKEKIKQECAYEISKNKILQGLIAEEYGLKPDELECSVYGANIKRPIGYGLSTTYEESENWIEYITYINTSQKEQLESEVNNFVDDFLSKYSDTRIEVDIKPEDEYDKKFFKNIISVNIELYIPFDKDESFCKSCIHEFRLFLENYSTKFLHREYLLSNDLRLTYYGRNLINATKKGANLSDHEIDEDFRNIFSMASAVSKATFIRLKEYRDLN